MKPLRLLAVAAALLIAAPLAAQTPAPPAARPDSTAAPRNTAAFLLARADALELTEEQTARLNEIVRESAARLEQMRTEFRADRPAPPRNADARAALERRRETRDAMLDALDTARTDAIAVLTPDQRTEALELLAQRIDRRQMMAQRPRAQRRPMRAPMGRGRPGNRPPRPDTPPPPQR